MNDYAGRFTADVLRRIFPRERSDRFFEALFGDPEEGSFDIRLELQGAEGKRLEFEFKLEQRPGKCLACNLTYGLPDVFSRHPVIDIPGVVRSIGELAGASVRTWELGRTREESSERHAIPLTVHLE
jgi:hypothetical protein